MSSYSNGVALCKDVAETFPAEAQRLSTTQRLGEQVMAGVHATALPEEQHEAAIVAVCDVSLTSYECATCDEMGVSRRDMRQYVGVVDYMVNEFNERQRPISSP